MKMLLPLLLLGLASAEQKPVIIEHPKDVYIGKSSSAEIRCEAKYATQLQFRCNDDWFSQKAKPVQWADEGGIKHVSLSATISKSKVTGFFYSDNEDFRCNCVAYAEDTGEPVHSRSATIKIAFLKSDFEEEPHNENKVVGEPIEINCVPPAGEPKPKVSWLKDGQLIDPNDDRNLMIDYKGSLVIRAAKLRDAGKYTCMAENMVETRRSQPAKIDVYIDGMWGNWGEWSTCPVNEHSCIKETKRRQRSCDSPAPTGESARQCQGSSIDEDECSASCVIDGGWSSWSEWSPCNERCVQGRTRQCNRPKPQNGGAPCDESDHEQQQCTTDYCKNGWMTTLADQPALIAGLAVVSVLFLLAAGVGLFLCHKIHKNKAKHNSPGRYPPLQTSRCSDLYERYIPGYISTSASSAGDSSQMNNLINNRNDAFYNQRQGQKTVVDYENNYIEKRIIASQGDKLSWHGVRVEIPPDALQSDQVISLRVFGGEGPLLPPHQILLSPFVTLGPSQVYFKKPVQMFIPHCINYNMDQHQPAVVKSNHAVERQTADNFYGWETEIKPPGPQLKQLQRMKRNQVDAGFVISTSKPGSWVLVGSPKVSNVLNMHFSSKSIAILVFGHRRSESDFQIRIRVCDYLASTMAMIDQEEVKEPGVLRLADAKVIGVARSTSGLRIKLSVSDHCDWRCTMVTCSQEVSTTQLWRRAAAPVCFELRKTGPGSHLMLNVELGQGHNGQTHYVPITHPIQ